MEVAALGGGEGGAGGGDGGRGQAAEVPLETKVRPDPVQGLPPHTPVLPLTSSRVRAAIPCGQEAGMVPVRRLLLSIRLLRADSADH